MKGILKTCIITFILSIVYQHVCGNGYTWSEWSHCSSACLRTRTCLDKHCPDNYQIEEPCYEPSCPDSSECASNPCKNGGFCKGGEFEYTCNCSGTGYIGQTCETSLDECLSNPCLNGGTCYDKVNHYICRCPQGFTNDHCQTNVCDDPYCEFCPGSSDLCDVCEQGFRETGNRKCEPCVDNCIECPYTKAECTICKTRFGLTSSGQCLPCQLGLCLECNYDTTSCRKCEDGYMSDNGKCEACLIRHCYECDNLHKRCSKCHTGFKVGYIGNCEAGRHCYSCDSRQNEACDPDSFSNHVANQTCDGLCYVTKSYDRQLEQWRWNRGCSDDCVNKAEEHQQTSCCDSNHCNVGSQLTAAGGPITITLLLLLLLL